MIFVALLLTPTLVWDGGWAFQCRFHILDSHNLWPVRDAKIRVVEESQLADFLNTNYAAMFPVTITDTNGFATVVVPTRAGGSQRFFSRSGSFGVRHELLIEADGYRPLSTGLANVVGGRRWPLTKRVFDVELVMFKIPDANAQ